MITPAGTVDHLRGNRGFLSVFEMCDFFFLLGNGVFRGARLALGIVLLRNNATRRLMENANETKVDTIL